MACRCDPLPVAVAALVMATAGVAVAERACEGDITLSLIRVHQGVDPAPGDQLGLDLRMRGLEVGWGGGCDVRRHVFELVDLEAADHGQPDRTVLRFGTYRHGWQGRGWTAELGLRGLIRWGESWRFATPVVGGSVTLGRALVRAELELGGLSLARLDVRRAHRRTDVALEARVAWPAEARARAELHLRLRDLAMTGDRDVADVTVTAGVGLALAARDRVRALPGFVGVATRSGADRTTLVVVEWDLGAGPP